MGLERLKSRGFLTLLVRVGLVVCAVGLCVHVYLEMTLRHHTVAPAHGHTAQANGSGAKEESAAEAPEDSSLEGKMSQVRMLKKESLRDVHTALHHRKVRCSR
ncbi:unnamed protein product [Knipowitschia caucasica]|uniref:Uncharacterized protein n=1 Tax=Knipowitschia caucasica TaxID=637954 RepID=A0AAV2KE81_KNICA